MFGERYWGETMETILKNCNCIEQRLSSKNRGEKFCRGWIYLKLCESSNECLNSNFRKSGSITPNLQIYDFHDFYFYSSIVTASSNKITVFYRERIIENDGKNILMGEKYIALIYSNVLRGS